MYCNSTEKYGTATMMVSSYIEQKSEQPGGSKQIEQPISITSLN